MNHILSEIVAHKKKELLETKASIPQAQLEARLVRHSDPVRNFRNALTNTKPYAIIAEMKKASPSCGLIRPDFDASKIARIYHAAGVAAISVLTETKYFMGRASHLSLVRQVSSRPILRKDFIIDAYQIYESRLLGADAVLFIVSLLSESTLAEFLVIARKLQMDALVEVHTEDELRRALDCNADIIGINNRNLRNMKIDLGTSEKLIKLLPQEAIAVAESGIERREELAYFSGLGYRAFLIGTGILKAEDMAKKIAELKGEGEQCPL